MCVRWRVYTSRPLVLVHVARMRPFSDTSLSTTDGELKEVIVRYRSECKLRIEDVLNIGHLTQVTWAIERIMPW